MNMAEAGTTMAEHDGWTAGWSATNTNETHQARRGLGREPGHISGTQQSSETADDNVVIDAAGTT